VQLLAHRFLVRRDGQCQRGKKAFITTAWATWVFLIGMFLLFRATGNAPTFPP